MVFNTRIEKRELGTWVVCPEGRLDSNTAAVFEEKTAPFLTPGTKVLILDLKNLTYLSSAGVRVIFKIRRALVSNHAAFIMTHLQPQIRKVFEIINALPDVAIFESMEEADRYLDAIQKKEIENQSNPPITQGGDDA